MKVRITVSLPEEQVEAARRAVEAGEAKDVSAYVSAALDAYTESGTLEELLDRMLEESGGPMTPEEIEFTDGLLDGTIDGLTTFEDWMSSRGRHA
jgi:Arc/MetJ-type ribon-helix-helix transcriptional regulator